MTSALPIAAVLVAVLVLVLVWRAAGKDNETW